MSDEYDLYKVVSVAVIVLLLVTCCFGGYSLMKNKEVVSDGVITEPVEPVVTEQAEARVFNGTGTKVIYLETLSKGVHIVSGIHGGDSNFIVTLVNDGGSKLLFNEIGYYEGETTVRLPYTSDWLLEVEADGVWALLII